MEENIKQLVGILLRAEETETPTEIIIDGDTAYDVACILRDDLGKYFEIDDEEEFEELMESEDILGVSVDFFRGKAIYFLQSVLAEDRTTLVDDVCEELYIHEDVFEDIDTNKFSANEIIILEEIEDEDVSELEEELEEYLEDSACELLYEIDGNIENDEFCLHCAIKEKLEEVFMEGYRKSQEVLRDALNQNLNDME